MTDREMMELAAKARGNLKRVEDYGWLDVLPDGSSGAWWEPLHSDDDAFRLALRLELDVMHRVVGGKRVEVLAAGGPLIQEFYEGEPYAAARRAIVRAAAEVARKLATKETA